MPSDDMTPLDRLLEAVDYLIGECRASMSFVGVRHAIGNTNFACLEKRVEEAKSALSAFEAAEPDAYEITLHLTGSRYADVNPVHAEDFRNRGDATVRDLYARSRHE